MKNIYLLFSAFLLAFFSFKAKAQCSFVTINTTATTCSPGFDGTIFVSMTNGINYNLQPGNISNTSGMFTGLSVGSYTITGTDATNCSTTAVTNVMAPPPLFLTAGVTNVPLCNAPCSGTGFTQATGGTPAYVYNLFPNAIVNMNGQISGLCANTSYTIIATDANGCTATSLLNVGGSILIQYSTVTNTSCGPTVCDASVVPQVFSGNAPYTCNLTDGNLVNITQGIAPFNNLCNGTYTLTITDATNCMTDTVFTITTSAYNNAIDPNVITGAGSISAAPTGGTAPYQYSLNGSPFTGNNGSHKLAGD